MSPLVSILIPCFNSEKWLRETLNSALSQTWENKEIIVVDDGSTDNSLSIARQFESSVVKVIPQGNLGAGAARNTALGAAQGHYIQYLDADDLLASDKIKHQISLLKSYPNHIAAGAWGRFNQSLEEGKFIQEPVWNDFLPVDWLVSSWMGGGMMHPAAWLLPREVANAAGPWNTEDLAYCPNDDGEYFCRVILSSHGVKFCAESKTYYRSGLANSLSRRRSKAAIKSIYSSLEMCISHVFHVENSVRTREAAATILQRFVYDIYPYEKEIFESAEAQIRDLGGSSLSPGGGQFFCLTKKLLGWKIAKRLQLAAR